MLFIVTLAIFYLQIMTVAVIAQLLFVIVLLLKYKMHLVAVY